MALVKGTVAVGVVLGAIILLEGPHFGFSGRVVTRQCVGHVKSRPLSQALIQGNQ